MEENVGFFPPMTASPDKMRERLAAALKSTGWKSRPLSEAAGLGQTAVRDIIGGRSRAPKLETYARIADALKLPLSYFTDDHDPEIAASTGPSPPASVGTSRPAQPTSSHFIDVELPDRWQMPRDLPVYGTSAGSARDGAFSINLGDVVDRVRRPPGMASNKKAYGTYLEGDSMEPLYHHGQLILVDPTKPTRPRDRVVVLLANPHDSNHQAFVKELVRRDDDQIVVRQFNPPQQMVFSTHEVAALHRIVDPTELLLV
jgi:SOS-response transcriptional repressor LexA